MFNTETIDPFDIDKNDLNETATQSGAPIETNNNEHNGNDEHKGKGKGKSKAKSKIDKSVNSMHMLLCYSDKYEGTFQILDGNDLMDAAVITIKDPNNQLIKAKVLNPTFDLGE